MSIYYIYIYIYMLSFTYTCYFFSLLLSFLFVGFVLVLVRFLSGFVLVFVWFRFGYCMVLVRLLYMKAHKLPSGSWRVQLQINVVRRSFTAISKKEEERAAPKSILNRPEAPTIDFRHAVEYFIANRENVLSASTTARYKRIVKKYMF